MFLIRKNNFKFEMFTYFWNGTYTTPKWIQNHWY